MAQRPFPVQWARQSAGASRSPADGSRLIDAYAVNPAALPTAPEQPKVQVIINPGPSRAEWMRFPAIANFNWNRMGGGAIVAEAQVNGIAAIESPTYGRRLVGVTAGWWFFEILFGGPVAGDPDSRYTGRVALQQLQFNADRFTRYTGEDEEEADHRPVRLASDGRRVMFVVGRKVFMYDSDTSDFVLIKAPTPDNNAADLPDEEWIDVVWSDGFFVLFARNGQVFHSLHDSVNFNQLDFQTAESDPDENIGAIVHRRQIWIFGSKSIERWYNAGLADFAFARDNSFSIAIGCSSIDTVQKTTKAVYFLGNDGIVYQISGSEPVRVSHEGVERDLANSDMTAARAFTYVEEGHRFYSLTLIDGADKSNWTYDETTGFWHERSETEVLCATNFGNQGDTIVGCDGLNSLYALTLEPFRTPPAIESTIVSPNLFSRTTRTQVHSLEIHTSIRPGETAPVGTAKLQMSHDSGRNWQPPNGQVKALAPAIRFNKLGSDRLGLGVQFRLILAYQPVANGTPVKVLGAYGTASGGLS